MPLISAALIVKNEAQHLSECLASLVGVVDAVEVVDTGSTDDTVAIAEAHGARVLQFPWQNDFAAARNFALEHARGEWVLIIDADERVQNAAVARARLQEFQAQAEATSSASPLRLLGAVEILNLLQDGQQVLDHTPRFFRRDAFRYEGAIHEQLVPLLGEAAQRPTGVRLLHLGYGLSGAAAEAKAARNIALLQAQCAEFPDDEYARYQLGKSFFSVRRYSEAVEGLALALQLMDWHYPARPGGRSGPVPRKVLTDLVTTLAYALVNNGDTLAAHGLLKQHQVLGHPGTQRADFLHVLGYVELVLGNLAAARAAYEASLKLGPEAEDVLGTGSFASHYHLGLIAEAEGDLAGAWACYGACLQQKADYAPALRRAVELSAEQQLTIPPRVLAAMDQEAFHRTYVARMQQFLENAQVQEAGHLAKAAARIDAQLFQLCRAALHQFAKR